VRSSSGTGARRRSPRLASPFARPAGAAVFAVGPSNSQGHIGADGKLGLLSSAFISNGRQRTSTNTFVCLES